MRGWSASPTSAFSRLAVPAGRRAPRERPVKRAPPAGVVKRQVLAAERRAEALVSVEQAVSRPPAQADRLAQGAPAAHAH